VAKADEGAKTAEGNAAAPAPAEKKPGA